VEHNLTNNSYYQIRNDGYLAYPKYLQGSELGRLQLTRSGKFAEVWHNDRSVVSRLVDDGQHEGRDKGARA
jgi:hypothetical protein